jgi:RNA polymerase sigma-70 factor (ECF subfamily)
LTTDEQLVDAWRGGDDGAGEELFDRHYDTIVRFFRNKVGDRLDDLVQATFMAILEAPGAYRGEGSFRGYLFGVAYNVLRRHFRDARRDQKLDPAVTSVHALGVAASVALDRDREHRRLLEALRRIPIEHQTLLELYYWESLSASAIAGVLEVPEGTVRTRLRRARSLLEQELERIVDDREQLESTRARLEDWARAVRDKLE